MLSTVARYKEVDCDSCQAVSRLVAGVLGQENTIIDLVEYLATNFCLTGVPEDDVEFCDVRNTEEG